MMPAGTPDTRELAEELARLAREEPYLEAVVYTAAPPGHYTLELARRRYIVALRHYLTGAPLGRIVVEPDGAVHAG